MKINQFGECILNENEIMSGLYSGKIKDISSINIDDKKIIDQYNNALNANFDDLFKLKIYSEPLYDLENFDKENQKIWNIPIEYQNFDISSWLFSQCKTDEECNRVKEELILFNLHKMIDVLKCLKYFVDFMREHDIVWGVGRGSSVSSYCLFLIGIHKINSMKYDLDIREFLKGEING